MQRRFRHLRTIFLKHGAPKPSRRPLKKPPPMRPRATRNNRRPGGGSKAYCWRCVARTKARRQGSASRSAGAGLASAAVELQPRINCEERAILMRRRSASDRLNPPSKALVQAFRERTLKSEAPITSSSHCPLPARPKCGHPAVPRRHAVFRMLQHFSSSDRGPIVQRVIPRASTLERLDLTRLVNRPAWPPHSPR